MFQDFLDSHFDDIKEHITETLMQTLISRHMMGKMKPITRYKEYCFDLVMLWNTVATSPPGETDPAKVKNLTNSLNVIFHKEALSLIHKELTKVKDQKADFANIQSTVIELITDQIHAGVMTNPYNSVSDHSFVFNGKYKVTINEWELSHSQWDTDEGDYKSIPCKTVKPIIHMEVDLPSGELLISDWIDIPEFTTAMQEQDLINISYAADRIERTVNGVKNHNVIEVAVGNSMPSIALTSDDTDEVTQLRIGCIEYEEDSDTPVNPELDIAGTITTSYNGTTIVDKEDLYDILRDEMSKSKALQKIDDLINAHPTRKPTVIKVNPGVWHFYFVEYGIGEIHQLEHATKDLGDGFETILMLSKTKIDFDDQFITYA